MAVVDRYIGELETLRAQIAVDSLSNIPESDKNAFGYGKAVGRLEGLRLAETLLHRVLDESAKEKHEDDAKQRRGKA